MVLIGIVIMLIVGILKEKKLNIREEIAKKPVIIRWSIYYLLIFFIIIFGAYGAGYVPIDPIYANF